MSNPSWPQGPHNPEGHSFDTNVATVPQPYAQPGGFGEQPQGAPLTAKQAQARAKAAKAEAKALRPWFKKKRFILPLLLVALIVIVQLGSGGSKDATTAAPAGTSVTSEGEDSGTTEASEETESLARIGEAAKAGDWTFKVTKFRCGESTIGDDFSSKEAQGQFCLMNLSVTNNGDEAATLMGDNQKVLDAKGREFSPDSEAFMYVDSGSNLLIDEINPGNTAKGILVFDVPKKTTPVTAVLAGGLFGVVDVVSVDLR